MAKHDSVHLTFINAADMSNLTEEAVVVDGDGFDDDADAAEPLITKQAKSPLHRDTEDKRLAAAADVSSPRWAVIVQSKQS